MNMQDRIMFGVIIFGIAAWGVSWTYVSWKDWRLREEQARQLEECVVPVNYSAYVREAQRIQNDEACGFTTEEQERSFDNLLALRTRVGIIRLNGFDASRASRLNEETFAEGINRNPYPKGSGEAQQWARGYCQDRGEPPKGWMERA